MSTFYEKLAEAKKSNKDDKFKRVMGSAAVGAAAAGGDQLGLGVSQGLARGVSRSARRADEANHLRKLHAMIDPEIAQIVSEDSIPNLLRKTPSKGYSKHKEHLENFISRGARFRPDVGISPQGYLEYSVRSGKGRAKTRGMIASSLKNTDTTSLMHELGHATGKLGYGKNRLYTDLVSNSGKLVGKGLGRKFGIGRAGVEAYNIGGAKSKEDLDRIEKRTNILTGLHGLAASPLLFEEGRANVRAVGLGKKFGAKVNKLKLGAGMGTYLAGVAGQTLLPHYLIKRQIRKRRKALEDNS
jgi:hypothetical protein